MRSLVWDGIVSFWMGTLVWDGINSVGTHAWVGTLTVRHSLAFESICILLLDIGLRVCAWTFVSQSVKASNLNSCVCNRLAIFN